MVTLISHSVEETVRTGTEWGQAARPGWIVGLSGELGAGKTHLIKGIVAGVGSDARVRSPTFALLHLYSGGRLAVAHLDLYRLADAQQLREAGLEEYLYHPRGVTVVEWVEHWLGNWPFPAASIPPTAGGFRYVAIESVDATTRRIAYEDFGP